MTMDTPSQGDAHEEQVIEPVDDTGSPKSPRWIVGAVVALVLIVGGAAFAIRTLLGGGLDSLQAIPDDVDVVLMVDLLALTDSERFEALITTFAEPMEDAGYIESSEIDVMGQIDEALEEELDLDIEEDIIPWVGRSISLGVWAPPDLETAGTPDSVFSMTIRDKDAAGEFLLTLDDTMQAEPIGDGEVYTSGDDAAVAWVGDELLLFATDRSVLRSALDARESGSIMDDETFTSVVERLPDDRLAAAYVSTDFIDALAGTAGDFGADAPGLGDIEAFALSMSLPDSGLRFDVVQQLAEGAAAEFFDAGSLAGVSRLPADTIGYMGFETDDGAIQRFLDEFRELDPVAYEDMAAGAEDELGVDLLGETLPSIGGEVLLAVVPTRDGMLFEETGEPIGVLSSTGLVDPEPMKEAVAAVERLAADEGVEIRSGSPSVAILDGSELFAYEVTSEALVVGSASSIVEAFLSSEGGVTGSSVYLDLDSELPGEGLGFFVDFGRVFDLIDMTASDRAIADPVRGLGASYSRDGNIVTAGFLILIDYRSE